MKTYIFNGYGYKVTLDIGKVSTVLIRSNDNQERFEFTGSKEILLTNVKTWRLPTRILEWIESMIL